MYLVQDWPQKTTKFLCQNIRHYDWIGPCLSRMQGKSTNHWSVTFDVQFQYNELIVQNLQNISALTHSRAYT